MRGIVPKKIKGFRDIDANLNQLKWHIINSASAIYKKYGYEHWDTPVLEYADCLGKYLPETNNVSEGVYSFKNPEIEPVFNNKGEELRDDLNNVIMDNHFLTMRYDLTAPLARVYAESLWMLHLRGQVAEGKTSLFRRYQFGPVFRFEAKLDPGRFREFWQLDFDTVGSDDVSADAENCMILSDALEAIGLQRGTYIVKVNNRKILKGLLNSLGINEEEKEQTIMRIIDKIDKIGIKAVALELGKGRIDDQSGAKIEGLGLDIQFVNKIIEFLSDFEEKTCRSSTLSKLKSKISDNEIYNEGIAELEKIDNILENLGFEEDRIIFDPTLIRGMGYYTGPIFEAESLQTYIDEKGRKRKVGSICGGGRYDGLVEKLLGMKVPATGASIGVDRLAELLTLTNQVEKKADGPVLITIFDEKLMVEYQKIASNLRKNNISTEIYYGSKKQLKHQLSYADEKNCPIAILLGEDEIKKGIVSVRNLKLGKQLSSEITDKNEWKKRVQSEVKMENLAEEIMKMLL
jgi:histidyl-tRNA synthetase